MKKVIGYILLILSFLAWGLIALLPFIELSKAQIAGATAGLVIAAEVLFWLSILLLGKEVWGEIKSYLKREKNN